MALLQTLLVIVGFFALGIVLKMSGYPDTRVVHWNPVAVFLREHGIWFLLLPVLWVAFAAPSQRFDRGILSYRAAVVAGIFISGIIITLFLYAAVFPFTRPLFFQMH